MSASARDPPVMVVQPSLKFIDQSDNEEDGNNVAHMDQPSVVNGVYSAIPNERIGRPKEAVTGPSDKVVDDTACGFWIFRGPVIQKCVTNVAYLSASFQTWLNSFVVSSLMKWWDT